MLPIAADIAVRLTREQAQSALPDAPVVPDPPSPRRRSRGPRPARAPRMVAGALRRLAARCSSLADRIDRPAPARQ
jgi:hypothetical protein